jgi:hypothetical protein
MAGIQLEPLACHLRKMPKGEDGLVLEVEDIDELLSRTQAEQEDELGAAEPSTGDSFVKHIQMS